MKTSSGQRAARAMIESARELSLLGLVPESLVQLRRALDTLEPLIKTMAGEGDPDIPVHGVLAPETGR